MDLTDQYHWYLDNAGSEVAERFLAAFDEALERLAQIPTLGHPLRFRAAELRGMRSLAVGGGFGSHLIFYRIVGDGVSVERVMHGARDLERRLVEPPEGLPDGQSA